MAEPVLLAPNSLCAACLNDVAERRYCAVRCERSPNGTFDASERLGDAPMPHLHRVCSRCRYEWLESCQAIGLETAASPREPDGVVVLRFHAGECPREAAHTPIRVRRVWPGGAQMACGQCDAEWLVIIDCEYPPGVEGEQDASRKADRPD